MHKPASERWQQREWRWWHRPPLRVVGPSWCLLSEWCWTGGHEDSHYRSQGTWPPSCTARNNHIYKCVRRSELQQNYDTWMLCANKMYLYNILTQNYMWYTFILYTYWPLTSHPFSLSWRADENTWSTARGIMPFMSPSLSSNTLSSGPSIVNVFPEPV